MGGRQVGHWIMWDGGGMVIAQGGRDVYKAYSSLQVCPSGSYFILQCKKKKKERKLFCSIKFGVSK